MEFKFYQWLLMMAVGYLHIQYQYMSEYQLQESDGEHPSFSPACALQRQLVDH